MEAKDTKKYKRELSLIACKLNDLGARCALRYENSEQTLEDICGVGEAVFEIALAAGIREVVEWIKRNDFYNGTDPAGMCIESPLWQAKLKEWGIEKK